MKISILLFFFLSIFINAQKYNFTYEYTFKPDSLNLENVESEMMVLFVDKDMSLYLSSNKLRRDSAVSKKRENSNNPLDLSVSLTDFPMAKISYIIEKNFKSDEEHFYTTIGGDRFKLTEKPVLNWKILNETAEISGQKCQKATASFRGRDYEAWFSSDIPVQDGPYKFKGLPGLIVKVEDSRNHHVWQLKGIKKFRNIRINFSKYIPITELQYRQQQKRYIADPMFRMKEFNKKFDMTLGTVTSPDGTSYSAEEYMKMREKQIKENFKHNNNSIELK